MTDEAVPSNPQQASQTGPVSKKEDKKPTSGGGGANNGGRKRNASRTASVGANTANANAPRPSSTTSNKSINKKASSNPPTATDSGSDSRKANEPRRNEQRGKSQGGSNARGSVHRKGQSTSQNRQGGNKPIVPQPKEQSDSPAPSTVADSDALSHLQRVINDLKTTSNSSSTPNAQTSNLPANAPIFQPGASAFPGIPAQNEQPPRHRKAASLGTAGNPAYNSYSPNLGSMMEDVEEGQGFPMEEGEIQEGPYPAGHQRRSLSQSFTAPRFAALAAQQEGDMVGPTGRPQLAPGFMFGARRRPSQSINTPMGPPINEEDVGFQFPQQQQQQQNFDVSQGEMNQRKSEGGPEISGIMAEQASAKPCVANLH